MSKILSKLNLNPLYLVIATLFLVKTVTYYSTIKELNLNNIISTFIIFACLLIATSLSFPRGKGLILLIYALFSIIMLIDLVYVKYFNQLPSIKLLSLLPQLAGVNDSIIDLLESFHLLFIADLLILPLIKFNTLDYSHISKKVVISVFLAFMLLIVSYSSNIEFFSFHLTDVYNSVIAKDNSTPTGNYINTNRAINNQYTALAQGKNLIVIQVESLQNFVIGLKHNGQELTPFLNSLIEANSFYFSQYFQQLGKGNTSDAEFVTNNSLYPAMDGITYFNYTDSNFYGLPWLLKDQGYKTAVFHGYESSYWNRKNAYPKQGFDVFFSQEDFISENPIGMGINDKEFLAQALKKISNMEKPFYAFLVTLTSHHPYRMPKELQGIPLDEKLKGTLLGNYYNSINFVDAALEDFVAGLKEQGLYEDSIICIYGDHHGIILGDKESNGLLTDTLGHEYNFDQMMRVPLIIHFPGSNIAKEIKITGGQIDFLPTVANLLGIKNSQGVTLGQDLLSAKEGFVAQQTYMLKGSFIDNDKIFVLSRDGKFENSKAWDLNTREAIPLEQCRQGYERALREINYSDYLLGNNLIRGE